MKSISYCGVNCRNCPVYVATIENSDVKKSEVANDWSRLYNREFRSEDMTCFGCKSDTRFSLCSKCDIEKCNISKKNDNCRECREYPCERIKEFESNLEKENLNY